MKILITGSEGMLGQYFQKVLDKEKYEIYKTSKRKKKYQTNYIQIDFLNFTTKTQILLEKFVKPDLIIHCAALTNVDECEKKKTIAYNINCDSTKKLIQIFPNIKKIFISSDAVFGNERFRTETSKTKPINYYGITKCISENLILAEKNNIVIRTTPVGFNFLDKNSFVDWILNEKNKKKLYSNVFFNPIHCAFLVKHIMQLIKLKKKGIWHINSHTKSSKFDFGIRLNKALNLNLKNIDSSLYDINKQYAQRSKNQFLNCKKFSNEVSNLPTLFSTLEMLKNEFNLYAVKN